MESKTPEGLAVIATNKSKYYQYPAGSYSAHTVETAFFDGFLAGYAAALPKWISTAERYPHNHELVLCSFCGIVSYGKWSGQVWVVNDEPEASLVKTDIISFVTHWMPLPALPTKEP